ncbi:MULTISPECIES: YopX family protein [Desulfitobacterium]|uniref:Phage uncharacterized protein TIGR01671 n=1 Tax=Desulfitobacterium chlororespirans DSM 11544 TaxID=1121395 RepID=A0A1M7UU18_9FIRM|nr:MULTISPECIES: YopX family protein [Desulfitobacterium]SHN86482.1 phage uncharacterized protein TIGR01671 [Desulfitobacterium chlororespirans DSM 11544]
MDREIKFRGKTLDSGEWAYGYLTKMWGSYHIIDANDENLAYQVIPETIGQFPEVLDKNSKEIYEGDIVETRNGERFVIEFLTGSFFLMDKNGKGFELWHQCNFSGGVYTGRTWCGIIGNIYENMDLLAPE